MGNTTTNKQELINKLAELVELPKYALKDFTIRVEGGRVSVECIYIPARLVEVKDVSKSS
jgi:hypothetical protein